MEKVNRTHSDMTWTKPADYLGLSSETKETTDITNGSTYWEVDTSKLYIFYNGTWYEQQ